MTDRAHMVAFLRAIGQMQRYLKPHRHNSEARQLFADLDRLRVGILFDEMQRREQRHWMKQRCHHGHVGCPACTTRSVA